VGYQAMFDNTTGANNVAVGYLALGNNTTAAGNSAVGYKALEDCTTGHSNAASGAYSLSNVTTGDKNTAVGFSAGARITTANEFTAVGYYAGLYATGGSCTFVGEAAGRGVDGSSTATNNTAVGRNALYAYTSGDTNQAFGKDSLIACTTGTNNCGYGNSTLAGVTSGTSNTAMGSAAGNNITSGIANICIGVGPNPSSASAQEQIVIATNATSGAGDNTVRFGSDTGTVYIALNNSTTSWTKSSDERLKENIETSTAGLSFINDLRPVTFDWKKKRDIPEEMQSIYSERNDDEPCVGNGKKIHGFIAQEVEAVIANHPEIVEGNSITDIDAQGVHSLADGAMMPMMVKAVQELSTALDAALARIEELEA